MLSLFQVALLLLSDVRSCSSELCLPPALRCPVRGDARTPWQRCGALGLPLVPQLCVLSCFAVLSIAPAAFAWLLLCASGQPFPLAEGGPLS